MTDCNNCYYLYMTEAHQEHLWRATNKKVIFPHTCLKYNQRVFHYPYREPMIHPCPQCEKEKGLSMTNEITRDYFNKRQEELCKKWETRAAQIPKDNKAALCFYRTHKFEIYEDIEELYDMAITLSIKGE